MGGNCMSTTRQIDGNRRGMSDDDASDGDASTTSFDDEASLSYVHAQSQSSMPRLGAAAVADNVMPCRDEGNAGGSSAPPVLVPQVAAASVRPWIASVDKQYTTSASAATDARGAFGVTPAVGGLLDVSGCALPTFTSPSLLPTDFGNHEGKNVPETSSRKFSTSLVSGAHSATSRREERRRASQSGGVASTTFSSSESAGEQPTRTSVLVSRTPGELSVLTEESTGLQKVRQTLSSSFSYGTGSPLACGAVSSTTKHDDDTAQRRFAHHSSRLVVFEPIEHDAQLDAKHQQQTMSMNSASASVRGTTSFAADPPLYEKCREEGSSSGGVRDGSSSATFMLAGGQLSLPTGLLQCDSSGESDIAAVRAKWSELPSGNVRHQQDISGATQLIAAKPQASQFSFFQNQEYPFKEQSGEAEGRVVLRHEPRADSLSIASSSTAADPQLALSAMPTLSQSNLLMTA